MPVMTVMHIYELINMYVLCSQFISTVCSLPERRPAGLIRR